MLTPEEIERLNQLPDATCEMLPELECALEDGHAGTHVAWGQSQDYTSEDQTHWWLRWTDSGGREWTHEPACPARRGEEMCDLPDSHEGGHHWF